MQENFNTEDPLGILSAKPDPLGILKKKDGGTQLSPSSSLQLQQLEELKSQLKQGAIKPQQTELPSQLRAAKGKAELEMQKEQQAPKITQMSVYSKPTFKVEYPKDQEITAKVLGFQNRMQMEQFNQEDKEAKQKKLQEAADDFYNTTTGKLYFNVLQPMANSASRNIGNVGATVSRMLGEDQLADKLVDTFTPEKRYEGTIAGTKPTKLQGNLFNNGKMDSSKLPSKIVGGLTDMAWLLAPVGTLTKAGKAAALSQKASQGGALFGSSYLQSREGYYQDGKAAGLKGEQLDYFASGAAVLTSSLEALFPNDIALGGFRSKMAKEYAKQIAQGVTAKTALKAGIKDVLVEAGIKEPTQELLQLAGDKVAKTLSDMTSGKDNFGEQFNWDKTKDEIYETVVITPIISAISSGSGALRNYTPSNYEKSLFYDASNNSVKVFSALDKQLSDGTITQEQHKEAKDKFTKYNTAAEQVKKLGYSDDQTMQMAWELFSGKEKLPTAMSVSADPILKDALGQDIKKDKEAIADNIRTIGMGVPSVGSEIDGKEVSYVISNIGNKGVEIDQQLVDNIGDDTYRVEDINVKNLYNRDPAFKQYVDGYKKGSIGSDALMVPAVMKNEAIIDGRARLAEQYLSGKENVKVFKNISNAIGQSSAPELSIIERLTPEQIEVSSDPTDFANQMNTAQSSLGKMGMSVSPYAQEDYDQIAAEGGKFLRAANNKILSLLKPNGEMVSLVKDASVKTKGAAQALITKMKEMGGLFMDNYDIYLTPIYEKAGYEVVARVPFNEQYAPEGWDAEDSPLKNKPDVVFMVRKDLAPAQAQTFQDYEEAQAFTQGIIDNAVAAGSAKLPSNKIAEELMAELGSPIDETLEAVIPNAQKSLEKAEIKFKVVDGETDTQGARAARGNQGLFVSQDGTVIIDKSKLANEVEAGLVVWHEASHPVMNIIRNTNKNLYDSVVRGLNEAAKTNKDVADALAWAKENYSNEDVQNDESVVETIGRINSGLIDVSKMGTGLRQKLIDFVNSIAKFFGIDPILNDTDLAAFKKTVSQVADALKTGRDISEVVGEGNVGKFKNELVQQRITAEEVLKKEERGDKKVIEVADAFEKAVDDVLDPQSDPKSRITRFLKNAYEDLRYFLSEYSGDTGLDWYTNKVKEFDAKLKDTSDIAIKNGEMSEANSLRKPENMDLFKVVLALSSIGVNPRENVKSAFSIWKTFNQETKTFSKYQPGLVSLRTNIPDGKGGYSAPSGEIIKDTAKYLDLKQKNGKVLRIKKSDLAKEFSVTYNNDKGKEVTKNLRYVRQTNNATVYRSGPSTVVIKNDDILDASEVSDGIQGKGWTTKGNIVAINLVRLENVLADHSDLNSAINWINDKHPINELRKYNSGVPDVDGAKGKINPKGERLGSYIIGEKLGAFHQNVAGTPTELTMDLWWSRTWNRYMGTLIGKDKDGEPIIQETPRTDNERNVMREAAKTMADSLGLEVHELQAALWYLEQQVYKRMGAAVESYSFVDGINQLLLGYGKSTEEIQPDRYGIDSSEADQRRTDAAARAANILYGEGGREGQEGAVKKGRDQASVGNRNLAPNGKPSNLNDKQYEQVRTTEFKNWFGDWENDPANASKVVDENGEPRVVYHGTNNTFDEFKKEKLGSKNWMADSARMGFFFAGDKSTSEEYTGMSSLDMVGVSMGVYDDVFKKYKEELDKANKAVSDVYNRFLEEEKSRAVNDLKDIAKNLRDQGIDEVTIEALMQTLRPMRTDLQKASDLAKEENDKNGNNDKLAGVNEKIYAEIEDSWKKKTGANPRILELFLNIRNPLTVDYSNIEDTNLPSDIQEAIGTGKDGVIFNNLKDGAEADDIFVALEPNQIKSATDNTGEFSTTDNRIQASVGNRPEQSKQFKVAAFVMRKLGEGVNKSEIIDGVRSATGMSTEEVNRIIADPEQYIKDSFPELSNIAKDNLVERAKIQNIYRGHKRKINQAFVGTEIPREKVVEYLNKTRKTDSVFKDTVNNFKNKWLNPAKGLPDWVLAIRDFSVGKKNIEVARAVKTIERLKAEANKIGFTDWDAFSKAMVAVSDIKRYIPDESGIVPFDPVRASEGKMFTTPDDMLPAVIPDAIKALPESIRPFAVQMRQQIDGLTKDLIGSGYVTPEQAVTLEKNLGQYVNRSYKMFNERGYKPTPEQQTEAIKFIADRKIKQILTELFPQGNKSSTKAVSDFKGNVVDPENINMDLLYEQAVEEAKKDVQAILDKKRNPYFNTKTDSRDTGILKKKEDIPDPIRKLMGEYTDPGTVFVMTVAKQAALASQSEYLKKLREFGMGSVFFEKNDSKRPAEFSVEIASTGTDSKSPLGGLYTTPEIAEALEMADPSYNELTNLWMKLVGAVRWGKTVGSVATQAKNFESNVGFAVLNGMFLTGENTKALGAASKYVKGQYSKAEIDQITEKVIKLNLVGQSVGARELAEMFGSGDIHDVALDIAANPNNLFGKKVKKSVNIFSAANKLYRMGDDFWKVYAYINEREMVAKGRFKSNYESLTPEQQEKIDIESSERVKNTWPTYDRVVEGAKYVSKRAPIFGNFISFQAESLRVLANSIKLAREDMKDPEMKAAGVKRMVGIMTYAALRTAITTGVASAAGMAASGILGAALGDDEEEQKKRAIKKAIPVYARTADIATIPSSEPHKFTVFSLSSLDPYGIIPNSLNALTEGREGIFSKEMQPGVPAAAAEFFSGFLEPEMTFSTMYSVMNNINPRTGRPIVLDSDTASEIAKKVGNFVIGQLEPSTISMIERGIERGWAPELASFAGARPIDVDLHKSFGYVLTDMSKQMDAIKSEYNSIKYNDKYSEQEKAEAELEAERKKAFLISKIAETYRGFIKTGANPTILNEMINERSSIKTTGFDKTTKKAIKTGEVKSENLFK